MWRNCTRVMLLAALLAACGHDKPIITPAAAEWADLRAPAVVADWALPTLRPGTHSPGLALTHDGRLLFSWVNSQRGRRHVFQFSTYDLARQQWRGAPFTVLVGNSLVTADNSRPHMAASGDGTLWAQWLQTTGPEGARDVMLSRSRDGGANWDVPKMPYVEREGHFQMSGMLWPEIQGIGTAWMDGAEAGGISLRTASVDAGGQRSLEQVLDTRANACERPGMALAWHGPLLVYRGGVAGDGHGIRVVRRDAQGWRPPLQVHANDGGDSHCPVMSGPVIAAHGQDVVVAWFSDDAPKPMGIRMALSTDAGAHFAAPVEIYRGDDAGYPLAVQMDAQQVWVLWEKMANEDDSLWLSRYSVDLQEEYERLEMARSHLAVGYARTLGAAQLALFQGSGYLVWAEERADRSSILRGVKILPAQGASPQ